MKVQYKVGNAVVEVDGKDTKDVFQQLSGAVEVFGHSTCGSCASREVVPSVREVGGNTYYEMRCTNCGACLAFGQRKVDGALYPKRKDQKTGQWFDNNGWLKFTKRAESNEDVAF